MLVTRKTDYGLRILLELSKLPFGTSIPAKELASRQGIPSPFLSKIVADLASRHILETKRGVKGGIRLSIPPESISILDVVEAIDGGISICYCSARPVDCPRQSYCPIRKNFKLVEEKLKEELRHITIANLAKEELKALKEA